MSSIVTSPYRLIYVSGLLIFLIAAFFSEGYFHPDEHFQILEFSNYKLGLSSVADLPWEFQKQIRPALQPLLATGVIRFLLLLHIDNPFTWVLILRVLTALFAWCTIYRITSFLVNDFTNDAVKKIFLLLSFFLWFLPVISVRFSSENYGGLTFLLAIYYMLNGLEENGKKKMIQFILSGLLLGFSFYFRFQIGFAMLGLGMWLMFVRKIAASGMFILFLSGITGMLISTIADTWFYGHWTCTPWNYFVENIIEHRANHWGVSPWWNYIKMFLESAIPPFSLLLLIFFFIGVFKKSKHVLTWCIIPFVIGHMVVGHKEMRFMFPMVIAFIFLASQGIAFLVNLNTYRTGIRIAFIICLVINILLLAINSIIPARDSICYFKFLHEYARSQKMELLCIEKNIYETVGLEVNFYKSKNVHCIVVCDTIEEVEYLNTHRPDEIYTLERVREEDISYSGYNKQTIYSLFPEWVLRNNFNNWQDRTRIWKIQKLEKIK